MPKQPESKFNENTILKSRNFLNFQFKSKENNDKNSSAECLDALQTAGLCVHHSGYFSLEDFN